MNATHATPYETGIILGAREVTALRVLLDGGFFRYRLERGWFREQLRTRLMTADRRIVPGVGFVTMHKLRNAGMVARDYTEVYGSTLNEVYRLC